MCAPPNVKDIFIFSCVFATQKSFVSLQVYKHHSLLSTIMRIEECDMREQTPYHGVLASITTWPRQIADAKGAISATK